jgi:hypothetical protein
MHVFNVEIEKGIYLLTLYNIYFFNLFLGPDGLGIRYVII